jgi:hypothetical protein
VGDSPYARLCQSVLGGRSFFLLVQRLIITLSCLCHPNNHLMGSSAPWRSELIISPCVPVHWYLSVGYGPAHQKLRPPCCYPRYLGITRRSCLEAHMVLDMEYREQERLEHGPGGPIFLLLSQLCPVSSTSLHHYRPGLASERTLAP